MGRIRFDLWQAGLGVVVCGNTGSIYTNQVGGCACLGPEVEGVFVPLLGLQDETGREVDVEGALHAYFVGPPHHGWCCYGMTDMDADVVERILWRVPRLRGIRMDRRRLNESYEAYVWVTIESAEGFGHEVAWDGPLDGRWPKEAVLTWENSD